MVCVYTDFSIYPHFNKFHILFLLSIGHSLKFSENQFCIDQSIAPNYEQNTDIFCSYHFYINVNKSKVNTW